MADQLPMFELESPGPVDPVRELPTWYTPSKERMTANRRVLLGLHPLGQALGDDGSTCGTCTYLWRRQRGKSYLKCDYGTVTGGPATDVRRKWRGCVNWAAVTE